MSKQPPEQNDVDRWVRPDIRGLSAYHVPESGGLIKLDAMENPFSWPAELTDRWLERLRTAKINRYPDPHARHLVEALRQVFAVPEQVSVMLGNGSDELIQIIVQAVAGQNRVVLSVEPGFSMYRMISRFVGVDYVGVPLRKEDFSLDGDEMLRAMAQHEPAVVFIAYPNNPTGNLFDRDSLCRIIEAAPGLVVIDEAYHAFAATSMADVLTEYSNVLLLRTLSKQGLAGLRLGFLLGSGMWLSEFDKIRLPYNVNVLTQLSAEFALQHHQLFVQQTQQLCAEREELFAAMSDLAGLHVFPSRANFILFRTPPGQADAVDAGLRTRGVLIKNLHGSGALLEDCLRVTVGTAAENQVFLSALSQVLYQRGS